MEKGKKYKVQDSEDSYSLLEEPAVAVGYGIDKDAVLWNVDDGAEEAVAGKRMGKKLWNSRPGVYTDEEFTEELKLSELSGFLTEEEVKEEFARCGVEW